MKIKVLICDDQAIVCEGLTAILNTIPEIFVVGVAHNGEECLKMIPEVEPDIVLMDLKMPVMNGIRATEFIKENYPFIFVLVLTTFDNDEWVIDAIRSGASGYLLKDTPKEDLVRSIFGTMNGQSHLDPKIAGKVMNLATKNPYLSVPDQQIINQLSEREREILHLLAKGMNNADIAKDLFLSDGTVKNYISNIFIKIGVTDRTQAALFAYRIGLG